LQEIFCGLGGRGCLKGAAGVPQDRYSTFFFRVVGFGFRELT
jgi:hypothetical protein